MNSSAYPDATAEKHAALWAARLDGSLLSAADRAALDAWLAEHPAHRPLLSSFCQFSADLEQQLPLLAGIKDWSAESTQTARPTPWLRWPVLAGAALTMAAAVAFVFWPASTPTQFESIATPLAQRQQLTLADGTCVDLNAHTSLRVTIDAHSRHIRLADGEAFFAVAKDAARPFVIETPAGAVRVTGTEFNVRTDAANLLEVTVREGSVQVRPEPAVGRAESTLTLAPGDILVASKNGVVVNQLSPAALDDVLAWRHGHLVFAGAPLREVLTRFARYHGVGLSATPAAADLPLGGRYSIDDLDGFLSQLGDILPVRVSRSLNGTTQIALRSEN